MSYALARKRLENRGLGHSELTDLPRPVVYPEIAESSLTSKNQKIYRRAKEDSLAIALTALKGAVAVQETGKLEEFVNAVVLPTSTRMARRLAAVHQLCPNEDIRATHVVVTVEGAERMANATAAMADAAEGAMEKILERPLQTEEPSLLEKLLSRRR